MYAYFSGSNCISTKMVISFDHRISTVRLDIFPETLIINLNVLVDLRHEKILESLLYITIHDIIRNVMNSLKQLWITKIYITEIKIRNLEVYENKTKHKNIYILKINKFVCLVFLLLVAYYTFFFRLSNFTVSSYFGEKYQKVFSDFY